MGRKKAPKRNILESVPTPEEAKEILKKRPKKQAKGGNRGRKATNVQAQERVVGVAQMLARRVQKHQIKAFMLREFGLSARQAEEYIARARAWLVEQTKRPKDEFIGEALGLYEEVIRHPESSTRERLEAQLALRQMLGLDAPAKFAATTPDGEESAPFISEAVAKLPAEQLKALHALQWAIDRAKSGQPVRIAAQPETSEAVATTSDDLTSDDNTVDAISTSPAIEVLAPEPQAEKQQQKSAFGTSMDEGLKVFSNPVEPATSDAKSTSENFANRSGWGKSPHDASE